MLSSRGVRCVSNRLTKLISVNGLDDVSSTGARLRCDDTTLLTPTVCPLRTLFYWSEL